eukprot:scaffold1105_cov140-Isochrysis_galbana.AAC.9
MPKMTPKGVHMPESAPKRRCEWGTAAAAIIASTARASPKSSSGAHRPAQWDSRRRLAQPQLRTGCASMPPGADSSSCVASSVPPTRSIGKETPKCVLSRIIWAICCVSVSAPSGACGVGAGTAGAALGALPSWCTLLYARSKHCLPTAYLHASGRQARSHIGTASRPWVSESE